MFVLYIWKYQINKKFFNAKYKNEISKNHSIKKIGSCTLLGRVSSWVRSWLKCFSRGGWWPACREWWEGGEGRAGGVGKGGRWWREEVVGWQVRSKGVDGGGVGRSCLGAPVDPAPGGHVRQTGRHSTQQHYHHLNKYRTNKLKVGECRSILPRSP